MSTEERINARIGRARIAWVRSEAAHLEISVNEMFNRIIDQARGATWRPAHDQPEGQDSASTQEKTS